MGIINIRIGQEQKQFDTIADALKYLTEMPHDHWKKLITNVSTNSQNETYEYVLGYQQGYNDRTNDTRAHRLLVKDSPFPFVRYEMKEGATIEPEAYKNKTATITNYDRAEVLREEWEPKEVTHDTIYFVITNENVIQKGFFTLAMRKGIREHFNIPNYSFSPTEELAEEIVQIREGKWLPKMNDEAEVYTKDLHHVLSATIRWADVPPITPYIYFPTKTQFETFKQKKYREDNPHIGFPAMNKAAKDWIDKNKTVDVADYSRQEVLQEEWEPNRGDTYYTVDDKNNINSLDMPNSFAFAKKNGYAFAPNEDLAQEIAAARESKWLPKKGDHFYTCGRVDCVISKNPLAAEGFALSDYDFNPLYYDRIFFPSVKQREAFIAKNKLKEEKCKTCGFVCPQGTPCPVYGKVLKGNCPRQKLRGYYYTF